MFRTTSFISGWTGPATLAGLAAFMAAPVLAGPVQIVSQERRISVIARPGDPLPAVSDVAEPTDAEPFIAEVVADASTDGLVARSTAGVNSLLAPNRFNFTGFLAYELDDDRVAENPEEPGPVGRAGTRVEYLFDVTFTLDERYDFRFTGDTTGGHTGVLPSSEGDFRIAGEGSTLFPDTEGFLEPGTYRMTLAQYAQLDASSPTLSTFRNDFDFALHLTPSDTNGGGGPGGEPNPIPLPPAAWSGLLVLGAAALTRVRRKLFA